MRWYSIHLWYRLRRDVKFVRRVNEVLFNFYFAPSTRSNTLSTHRQYRRLISEPALNQGLPQNS
ncbi:Protein of unknown function [Pyronema omphalodes CBS 100304]|uniref:Uncharacterized protein n=1 Tax=Pyronema omphalodes (strain CBS 100304) TaxID=1076935 RepID=U4KX92_PYROM|nr:Protein of unknown function [Pyronema omphalodes CBS 100304]